MARRFRLLSKPPAIMMRSLARFLFLIAVSAIAQQPSSASTQPLPTLTLQDALMRARANSVLFQAAITDQALAREDKVQARAALLPSVSYNNAYIFSQGRGSTPVA